MQSDRTIYRSIAKIPPFQVDPDGKLVPEKDMKNVKMMRPFFQCWLTIFSWPFLDLKPKGDWVCVSCSWIHRSIAKIQLFQVDPDGKFDPEKDIKNVKMMRPFFRADLNIFLTFSWFKNPSRAGFVSHAVRSNDPSIHRENSAVQIGSRWKIGPLKWYKACQNDEASFQCWLTVFSWPFPDFKILLGLDLCVMQLIQRSIDPSRKFRCSKWIQIANWSLKKIWKMSKW